MQMPGSSPERSVSVQAVLTDINEIDRLATSLEFIDNAARHAKASDALQRIEVLYAAPAGDDALRLDQFGALQNAFANLDRISAVPVTACDGIAAAHNELIRRTACPFILIVHPCALLSPNLLHDLVSVIQRPTVGVVEPRHLPIQLPKLIDSVTGETGWASRRCMLVLRSLLDELQGFNSREFPHDGFDIDLSWQARRRGYKIVRCSTAAVYCPDRLTQDGAPISVAAAPPEAAPTAARLREKYSSSSEYDESALKSFHSAPSPASQPTDGQAVAPASPPISLFLSQLSQGSPAGRELQDFVSSLASALLPASASAPVFLSVIIRTQGARLPLLSETLISLAAQARRNFEILLVCHQCDDAKRAGVQQLVESFPRSFGAQISLLNCPLPGRASPINFVFPHVRSQYAVVLDDDDFVFPHWTQTFEELASASSNALVRATCVRQDHAALSQQDHSTVLPVSDYKFDWPKRYNIYRHLVGNETPFMSVAFPAAAFQALGLRLDETLETHEDWDFITRCALLFGVASSPEITCVYRWWVSGHSSIQTIGPDIWEANTRRVRRKLDAEAQLFPPGAVAHIVAWQSKTATCESALASLAEQKEWLASRLVPLGIQLPWPETSEALQKLSADTLSNLLGSTSWRLTRPFRLLSRILGFRNADPTLSTMPADFETRQRLIRTILGSASWRATGLLRAVGDWLHRSRSGGQRAR